MTILMPIETLTRELDYKFILAHELLRLNNKLDIYIGSVPAIHAFGDSFQNGIYFGKTIFSNPSSEVNRRRYNQFKSNGFDIVYLHEEGAVWYGGQTDWEQTMKEQYDLSIFDENDVVCLWGELQKEIETKRNFKNIPLVVTGNPRFDLVGNYKFLYQEEVQSFKNDLGTFVLVNCNFGTINHGDGFQNLFNYYNLDDSKFEENLDHYINWLISDANKFYRFIHLIILLSVKFPTVKFLVRPHPSESIETYLSILNPYKNIVVERKGAVNANLLACRLLIHDGSTTSLEAVKAKIPILNFRSYSDDFDLFLPSQVGKEVLSVNEALTFVDEILNQAIDCKKFSEVSSNAQDLIHNLSEVDSIGILSQVILNKVNEQNHSRYSVPNRRRIFSWYLKYEMKLKISSALNTLGGNRQKLKRDKYLKDKFPKIPVSTLKKNHNLLNKKNHSDFDLNICNKYLINLKSS